jgi:hypothetical protein
VERGTAGAPGGEQEQEPELPAMSIAEPELELRAGAWALICSMLGARARARTGVCPRRRSDDGSGCEHAGESRVCPAWHIMPRRPTTSVVFVDTALIQIITCQTAGDACVAGLRKSEWWNAKRPTWRSAQAGRGASRFRSWRRTREYVLQRRILLHWLSCTTAAALRRSVPCRTHDSSSYHSPARTSPRRAGMRRRVGRSRVEWLETWSCLFPV